MKRSRIKLPYAAYKKLCGKIMGRDGWKCRLCKSRNNLHVHHVVFRSHGGDDAEWNLITLCATCHDGVHTRHVFIEPVDKNENKVDANEDVVFLLAKSSSLQQVMHRNVQRRQQIQDLLSD